MPLMFLPTGKSRETCRSFWRVTDMSKSKRRRRRKKKGIPGNGLGPHHEVSPMGHATRTPSKKEKQRKRDRRQKQKGWDQ